VAENKIKLSVNERMFFGTLGFPEKSDTLEQMMIRELLNKVLLSPEELVKVKFESKEEAGISWNPSLLEDKEFTFTDVEKKYLKDRIKKLNDEEKGVTKNNLDLVLKLQDW